MKAYIFFYMTLFPLSSFFGLILVQKISVADRTKYESSYIWYHLYYTQPVMRAIGVSHAACKDEFRQNLRSHSWSVFLLL